MKHLLGIVFFHLCAVQLYAQALPADTGFSTAFAFTTKSGNPTGTFLYKGTGGDYPLTVFAYSDGRKYLGPYDPRFNQPAFGEGVVYYPDGTTYIGAIRIGRTVGFQDWENEAELKDAFAAIHYADGTNFIGNADHYRLRTGFQFAPDGSYMLGSFWYRNPYGYYTYKTIHYDNKHKRVSEGYHLKLGDQEMDLATFIEAYKKAESKQKAPNNQRIDWSHKHSHDKFWIDFESYGYTSSKDKNAVGYYRSASRRFDDKYFVNEGAKIEDKWYTIVYTEPNDSVSIKTPLGRFDGGAQRVKTSNGMVFKSLISDFGAKNEQYVMAYILNNGDAYVGESRSGKFDGYGIYKLANNNSYYGNFLNGKRSGWGTFRFADGSYYKGAWADDVENGQGKMYSAAGIVKEEGTYLSGKLVRPGKNVDLGYYEFINEFPLASSNTLVTNFVTNKKLNGAIYTGNIVGDIPEGNGTLTMNSNGDVYSGIWHNGLPDGVFTITYAPFIVDGRTLNGSYVGGLKDFHCEGEGRMVLTTGETSGTWHEGKLNGLGMRRLPSGIAESGTFVNNVKEGRFNITNKNNYDLGYFTYVHGIRQGHAYLMFPEKGLDMEGEMVNDVYDGKWTVYARNMHDIGNGVQISAPSRLGYSIYKNGVEISHESNAEAPPEFNKNAGPEQPVCTYCGGAGGIGSGRYFMGKEIPVKCPRCGGTGYTWLNPK